MFILPVYFLALVQVFLIGGKLDELDLPANYQHKHWSIILIPTWIAHTYSFIALIFLQIKRCRNERKTGNEGLTRILNHRKQVVYGIGMIWNALIWITIIYLNGHLMQSSWTHTAGIWVPPIIASILSVFLYLFLRWIHSRGYSGFRGGYQLTNSAKTSTNDFSDYRNLYDLLDYGYVIESQVWAENKPKTLFVLNITLIPITIFITLKALHWSSLPYWLIYVWTFPLLLYRIFSILLSLYIVLITTFHCRSCFLTGRNPIPAKRLFFSLMDEISVIISIIAAIVSFIHYVRNHHNGLDSVLYCIVFFLLTRIFFTVFYCILFRCQASKNTVNATDSDSDLDEDINFISEPDGTDVELFSDDGDQKKED